MSLANIMVWILAQNDDLDRFQGCQSRPRINVFGWGVYNIRSVFRLYEIFELAEVGFGELCSESCSPRFAEGILFKVFQSAMDQIFAARVDAGESHTNR